ncbi:hypothetical protein BBJ28_00015700 [Nothophytophthora sp. Chile5]|nr:hypothetical protein BBJ28_00015700 [Nothophytophthora sp. Chile5]
MAGKRKRHRPQAPRVVTQPHKKSKKVKQVTTSVGLKQDAPLVAAAPPIAGHEQPPAGAAMNANAGDSAGSKKKKKKKTKSQAAPIATTAPVKSAGSVAITDKKKATKKGKSSEIDDLFATLKTTKQLQSIAEEQQKRADEDAVERAKAEKQRLQQQIKMLEAQSTLVAPYLSTVERSSNDVRNGGTDTNSTALGNNPDPRPVRHDEDGLPIYNEASLQIGKGGNTAD